jgi:hypothetical protein
MLYRRRFLYVNMRRRSVQSDSLNVCPMCKKVVEYGLMCESCACWFHANEQCCGDALATAFTTSGRDAWCCLNCYPRQGETQPVDPLKLPATNIDHVDWRRAFRILTDSCAGCGLKVRTDHSALRCGRCELAYHAVDRCTGLSEREIATHLEAAAAADDAAANNGAAATARSTWWCPTCMVHETGAAIDDALVMADCTGGQEAHAIPLLNEVDPEANRALPVEEQVQAGGFEYAKQVTWRHPNAIKQFTTLSHADWGGRCIDAEATSWLPGNEESKGQPIRREGGGEGAAYNRQGQLLFARDCIFECNETSSCGPDCPNRVVGRGVWAPLQVVKTVGRGWGVRCRQRLAAGSFVCEYTGTMLLDTDAAAAGPAFKCSPRHAPLFPTGTMLLDTDADAAGLEVDDSYLFNLDGEDKGQVSKRRRTGAAASGTSAIAAQTSKNPELAVDASRIGSVARFLNHCCEPNLFVQVRSAEEEV